MTGRSATTWALLAVSMGLSSLPFVFLAQGGAEAPPTPAIAAAWGALLVAVGATTLAHRGADLAPQVTSAAVLSGLGAVAIAALSAAVGAECQNYWPAFGFASQFWAGALAATGGLVLLLRLARAGSKSSQALLWPTGLIVGAYLLLWSWMTLPVVRDAEGAIVRWLFLQTHG